MIDADGRDGVCFPQASTQSMEVPGKGLGPFSGQKALPKALSLLLRAASTKAPPAERPLRHPGVRRASAVKAAEGVDSSSHTGTKLFYPSPIMDQESSYQVILS